MRGRALYKDMDRSELLAMREQGMSNREIADSVAVSYQTIYKLIGKQPQEMNAYTRRCGKASPKLHAMPAEEETHEACLTIHRPALEICGNKWKYRAKLGQGMIEVFTAQDVMPVAVDIEDLPRIIKELQAIVRNAEKITDGNVLEVW